MWWGLGLVVVCPLAGLWLVGWWAWREHLAGLDPVHRIRQAAYREARRDLKRALREVRWSRAVGTPDELAWLRELEDYR